MTYPSLGGAKLSERIALELEHRIMSGQLQPGERLPSETELGELLGASRTAVRDAVRTLAARGLIRVRQGHGMVVAEPSDHVYGEALVILLMRSDMTMGDVMDARAAIEMELGRLAAKRSTPADWKALSGHLDAFREAVAAEEWGRAEREHVDFHLAFLRSINLPVCDILFKPLQRAILLSAVPPTYYDKELWDVDAHDPILSALENRDEDALYKALEHHFRFRNDRRYSKLRKMLFRDAHSVHEILASMRTDTDQRLLQTAAVE